MHTANIASATTELLLHGQTNVKALGCGRGRHWMLVAYGKLMDCPRNARGTSTEEYFLGLFRFAFSSIIFGAGRQGVCLRDWSKGVLAVLSDDGQKPSLPPPRHRIIFPPSS